MPLPRSRVRAAPPSPPPPPAPLHSTSFNAGSASAANALAGIAMATTMIATAAAGLSWMFAEWVIKGKPTLMSVISGAVSGLVAITPACGFVDCNGAIIMGFITGIFCAQTIRLKHFFGYDDALDAFGVHGMGGAFGGILTGMFATPANNNYYAGCPYAHEACNGSQLVSGAFYDHLLVKEYGIANTRNGAQIGRQIYAIVVIAGYSALSSFIILKARGRPFPVLRMGSFVSPPFKSSSSF